MCNHEGYRLELFKSHEKLAYSIFHKYKNKLFSMEEEDLKQECFLCLWKATRDYDENIGYAFSTYATKIMENKMKDLLRNALSKSKTGLKVYSYEESVGNNEVFNLVDDTDIIIDKIEAERTIMELRERYAKVLEAQYYYNYKSQGYTDKEITILMNTTNGRVRYIKQLIEKMKKDMQEKEKELRNKLNSF